MGEQFHVRTILGIRAVHISSSKLFYPSTITALLGICLTLVWERLKLNIVPELASRFSNMSEIKVEAVFNG